MLARFRRIFLALKKEKSGLMAKDMACFFVLGLRSLFMLGEMLMEGIDSESSTSIYTARLDGRLRYDRSQGIF